MVSKFMVVNCTDNLQTANPLVIITAAPRDLELSAMAEVDKAGTNFGGTEGKNALQTTLFSSFLAAARKSLTPSELFNDYRGKLVAILKKFLAMFLLSWLTGL